MSPTLSSEAAIALVVIVPAAGFATRLQPLEVSKEVLLVRGRPMMDYLMERMQAVRATEIRVVTRPDKVDVAAYAKKQGAKVVFGQPASVAASVKLALVGLADDDTVLIGFPDTLIEDADAGPKTLEALGPGHLAALGLFHGSEPHRGDVVQVDHNGTVRHVEPKPKQPVGNLVWGLAAARAAALSDVRSDQELGEAWNRWARRGRVNSVVIPGKYLDIGTRLALFAVDPHAL